MNPYIDFGQMCGIVMLTSTASIAFDGIMLLGITLPQNCKPEQHPLWTHALRPNWGYIPYPAMLFAANSTVRGRNLMQRLYETVARNQPHMRSMQMRCNVALAGKLAQTPADRVCQNRHTFQPEM